MGDGSNVRLYTIEGSNSSLTGRLLLDHKRLSYERVDLPPALHALILRWRGFPGMTVPAIILDGSRVQGTLEISEALERACPEPPLFPRDADRRRRVREAEIWGEKVQNACRRIFYAAARRDRRVFSAFMRRGNLSAAAAFAVRVAAPLIIKIASKAHGSTDARAKADVGRIPENLDRVDGWLADGTLGNPVLNAADFQIAPNVRAMLEFANLAPFIEGRPCADWARRVVPDYGSPIGPVLPDAWLPLSTGQHTE